jgi:hypothetical protein
MHVNVGSEEACTTRDLVERFGDSEHLDDDALQEYTEIDMPDYQKTEDSCEVCGLASFQTLI